MTPEHRQIMQCLFDAVRERPTLATLEAAVTLSMVCTSISPADRYDTMCRAAFVSGLHDTEARPVIDMVFYRFKEDPR